jgi:hypothetical protein
MAYIWRNKGSHIVPMIVQSAVSYETGPLNSFVTSGNVILFNVSIELDFSVR